MPLPLSILLIIIGIALAVLLTGALKTLGAVLIVVGLVLLILPYVRGGGGRATRPPR